jgi:citrate/tricarballylate utilization protein
VKGLSLASIWQACRDAATLRYLDGGGMGCMNESERPNDRRRLYHHLTFYGFLLCFAATASGTVFHYFGWEAPYPLWHPTVLLGTAGGLGLVVGPIGLLAARAERDERITARRTDMGIAFIWMLLLTSVTGLLLLAFRSTGLMGLTLAIHLGVVFALFLSFPYGKFVHGFYRMAALVRRAHEQRAAGDAQHAEVTAKAA